ncbi:hypothetical protein A54_267 [Septuagintavirus sv54]|uniref:Uncharacterized protein n=1 Tax=Escherichia phage A5-4 TaxID=2996162 RepID=A0AAE9PSH6_9CAUD|nr:hypothetical protein A54_267 [Escherichia phage A5-4]
MIFIIQRSMDYCGVWNVAAFTDVAATYNECLKPGNLSCISSGNQDLIVQMFNSSGDETGTVHIKEEDLESYQAFIKSLIK